MPIVWLLLALVGLAVAKSTTQSQTMGKTGPGASPYKPLTDVQLTGSTYTDGDLGIYPTQKLYISPKANSNLAQFWAAFNRADRKEQQLFLTELAYVHGKVANLPGGYGRFTKNPTYTTFNNGKAELHTYKPSAVNDTLWHLYVSNAPLTKNPKATAQQQDAYEAPVLDVVMQAQMGWKPLGIYIINDYARQVPPGLTFSAEELVLATAKGAAMGAKFGPWGAVIGAVVGAGVDTYKQQNPNG